MSDTDSAATYSIKAVAAATGLTVETLRAWERRYRVIEPKRGAGGHRLYTTHDVSRLRRLHETTARGHAIGKIAHLSNDALSRLISDHPASGDESAAQALIERILAAVSDYRPAECDQAMAMAFALLSPFEVVRNVLSPALREVGERWHRGEISIAQERIASNCARRQLTALLHTFNSVADGPAVVFATLSGERHELGILMYATLAASLRLRTYYLGPDLPTEEAARCALKINATAVAISLVLNDHFEAALAQLHALRRQLPDEVEIWLGGPALVAIDDSTLPARSLRMLEPGDFEQRVGLMEIAR
jgi:DNA-binding transcriptional MerR regulator/methylmalonyl-CoA mutase cobalamin-binding subunit